jgi:hypothetical protein
MQPNKVPEFAVAYTYDAVADFYEHDATLVSFVIVKGPRIRALRLREDYNPKILATPAEVWVGERPPAVQDWGKTLANDTVRVPVFVKRKGKQNYTFVGDPPRPNSPRHERRFHMTVASLASYSSSV